MSIEHNDRKQNTERLNRLNWKLSYLKIFLQCGTRTETTTTPDGFAHHCSDTDWYGFTQTKTEKEVLPSFCVCVSSLFLCLAPSLALCFTMLSFRQLLPSLCQNWRATWLNGSKSESVAGEPALSPALFFFDKPINLAFSSGVVAPSVREPTESVVVRWNIDTARPGGRAGWREEVGGDTEGNTVHGGGFPGRDWVGALDTRIMIT